MATDRSSATETVGEAYDQAADLYVELNLDVFNDRSRDREILERFASEVGGSMRVLDMGCGPGHVTAHLAGLGFDAVGIDCSSSFIDFARSTFPQVSFIHGDIADLPFVDESIDGVVCRFSTVHIAPGQLTPVFTEMSRVLAPAGRLLLWFFATNAPHEHGAPFDHKVTTAYQADPDTIATQLAGMGLVEQRRHVRQPGPTELRQFPQAALVLQKVALLD